MLRSRQRQALAAAGGFLIVLATITFETGHLRRTVLVPALPEILQRAVMTGAPPTTPGFPGCPAGRFVTINPTGRLGNKLCQYSSLWARQLADASLRPAWIMPEMHTTLSQFFSGLQMPVLPDECARSATLFWTVSYFRYDAKDPGPPDGPVFLADHPCDLSEFRRHRTDLVNHFRWKKEVLEEAQERLRKAAGDTCTRATPCTYVAVHVRRTDYAPLLLSMYNGTLAGETYLTRTLALCRDRYWRPVFIVSSDDMEWCRQHLHGADVRLAGSSGPGGDGRDLALLSQCNHTVMTHGTYGFMAAFLAGGDVIVPSKFGSRESYLTGSMLMGGFNVTTVPVS